MNDAFYAKIINNQEVIKIGIEEFLYCLNKYKSYSFETKVVLLHNGNIVREFIINCKNTYDIIKNDSMNTWTVYSFWIKNNILMVEVDFNK